MSSKTDWIEDLASMDFIRIKSRFQGYFIQMARQQTTFMRLFESPILNYSQMDRLKTAEAIYEVVPIAIMSPYALFMLRHSASFQMSPTALKKSFLYGAIGIPIYLMALHFQSKAYFPLVAQVYLEVSNKERSQQMKLNRAYIMC